MSRKFVEEKRRRHAKTGKDKKVEDKMQLNRDDESWLDVPKPAEGRYMLFKCLPKKTPPSDVKQEAPKKKVKQTLVEKDAKSVKKTLFKSMRRKQPLKKENKQALSQKDTKSVKQTLVKKDAKKLLVGPLKQQRGGCLSII